PWPRPVSSRGNRCGCSRGITGRSTWTRTGGSAPRRSPTSSCRRCASSAESSGSRSPREPRRRCILAPMTPNGDPWRTLGLAPGATADEVRRAYRRLAKANHPDAAGESALPRFLAIQAAYEQLVGATVRRRPGSRPGTGRAAPAEPWRADRDRARASGRADGRRPGARPAGGRRGAGAPADEGPPGGAPGGEGGPGARRARARATAAGGRASAARRRAGRPRSGAAASGAAAGGPAGEGPARSRRGGGRRRAPNKAGPYSTSYDPADEEPFEPGWSGGSWYGTSSGTYWALNPQKDADPP